MHSESCTRTQNRLTLSTTKRGSSAREMSATSSRYRTYEGVLHWRLLGALIKGDARAAYSRRIVAPSSSLRRVLSDACAPRLLSVVLRPINLIDRSISRHVIISPTPADRSTASCPIRRATVSPCFRKEKRVWRSEACDGALSSAPPHSAAGLRRPAAIA